MIDVQSNYYPLLLSPTPYGRSQQARPDAQWEGMSLQSDGRVDDCFRQSPLCTDRSGEWIDLVDPRLQTFMTRMAELKSHATPGAKMTYQEYDPISQQHQAVVNDNLKAAGLRGSSSSCGDEYGALSSAFISLGGTDAAQYLDVKPTPQGFGLQLKSIGYGGSHVIDATADNQGHIQTESIRESAGWRVPWLDERILRNNDASVINNPHDLRLGLLMEAAENGRPLEAPLGKLVSHQDGVQTWNLAEQEIKLDYQHGSFELKNKGWVDPPAGSDFNGYDGETSIGWKNGRFGHV